MSLDMICNYKRCRKTLSAHAWVTSCSHAFCADHGMREFKRNTSNSFTCPACSSELRDKFDVIQAELNPSESFKSIVLSGMKPDVIMDIAMRAMSFWSYQVEQETLYQENLAKHAREKVQCLEELNALNMHKLKAELDTCKRKVVALQTECNKKKKQTEELAACLEQKSRRIQKLNFQMEAQKRRAINIHNDGNESCPSLGNIYSERAASDIFVFQPAKDIRKAVLSPRTPVFNFEHRKPRTADFNFRPV